MQVQVQIIRAKADPTYKPPFTSMPDCIKQSFAANGFRAPFQGFGPTLLRNIPANSIYLGSFEVMKIEAAKSYKCSVPELPAWVVLSAAGASPPPSRPIPSGHDHLSTGPPARAPCVVLLLSCDPLCS